MRPFILGIAGGTGSGKTTLARELAAATGATLISHDRYYHDFPDPHATNFDHPDALDTDLLLQHLDQLHAGQPAHLPVYDFPTHRRAPRTERVEPAPWMVVEGILVLADDRLCQRFDFRVYVHTPDDIRLLRRLHRDTRERGRSVDSVVHQYLDTVRPMHERFVAPSRDRADVVLDGTAHVDGEVQKLLTYLPRGG